MKFKLINWLRGKLRKRRRLHQEEGEPEESQVEDDVPNLPRLPSTRPIVLTPSPSTEALALASSPLFGKLPRELRYDILLRAFGGSLLHMDLSYVHPVAPTEPGRILFSHTGINTNGRFEVNWDTAVPKSWQWWSSVCHRVMPNYEKTWSFIRMSHPEIPRPGDDRCRYGDAHFCQSWPGAYPSKCKIGIMGWLLSCRQAYVEGIDVLYRTNTIHMSGQTLILNLPQLLPPQRLSAITSLEIVCPLQLHGVEVGAIPEVGLLNDYLSVFASNLPSLTRLYLALKAKGSNARPVDMQSVFEVLDAFVLETSLREFTVSHSHTVFTPLYNTVRNEITTQHHQQYKTIPEMWRNADGSYILPIWGPNTEPFYKQVETSWPKPPQVGYRTVGADVVGDGYWLVEGEVDDYTPCRFSTIYL
ncbi:hypothetical protein H0G86_002805 [Trichoderma simmonsii]|uniref:DUF7730 domain-containing protein n=1 Tax=Trichoderma simmonsii TaxID=1491479 RepID=A0A8G0L7D2_9HYPO|nr:hypothetical protein H0G86_002805 [Trichoderma simmonsii]